MKAYGGSEGTAPLTLSLGTMNDSDQLHAKADLYSREGPRYPTTRERAGWSHSWSEGFVEEENLVLLLRTEHRIVQHILKGH